MASNADFTELPAEILSEIAKRTDARTLLALRQTCRRLCAITRTQTVWSGIAQDMEALPGASCIEKPRAECSAQELEAWTLERLRVQELYSLSKTIPAYPQCREFSFPEEVTDFCLLPGGKRLLAFTRFKGAVYQCDLSSLSGNICELISAGRYNDEAGNDDVRHAIWIDKSRPRLTFRLALYSRFWCSTEGATRASVYHVTLSSSGTCLEATHITTFLMPPGEAKIAAALDRDRFLLIMKSPISARSTLSVYYYTKPHLPSSQTEIHTEAIVKIRLIPDDRLLVICKSTMKIYDLSMTFHDLNTLQNLSPWWQLPRTVVLRSKQYIEPIITPSFTRVTIATDGAGVIGVSIPHDIESITQIITLAQETARDLLYCSGAMGHFGSIFLDWRCRVHILRYCWDSSTYHSRKSFEKGFSLLHSDYNLAVDRIVGLSEERGRIVLHTNRSNLAVIDLIPSLYES